MYTSFYHLNKKPFQISSDPEFMWFGEKHKEALATLKYGILDNKGFLLLTGDVGTGKTTLINALLQSLDDDIVCTSVPDPGLEKMDFFNYIASAFGIEDEFATKGKFLAHFRNFLIQANEGGKKVLLIIDEAQLLTQEMLEEIRLLSNIEKVDTKLINIFFIGQNEFNEILNREQNRAVRQRLTLNYNIDPLSLDETAEYITHRLKIAGATETIFDMSSVQEVFTYSGGFPRRINVICDHSLLSGYVKEQKVITAAIVSECAKELKIPAFVQNRDINGFATYHERKPPLKPNPSVRQKPVPPSIPEIEPEKERAGKTILTGLIFVVIFIVFTWFLFFPREFNSAMGGLGQGIKNIRQGIASVIPEPYGSIFYQEPHVNRTENELIPEKIADAPSRIPQPVQDAQSPESPNGFLENNPTKKNRPQSEKNSDVRPAQPGTPKKKNIVEFKEETILEDDSGRQAADRQKIENTVPDRKMAVMDLKSKEQAEAIASEVKVEKKIFPLPREKVIVRFKYNTNDFTDEGYSKLVAFSEILVMHPEARVMVSGYTDSEGYQKYNRKLSEFRANIVKSFLLGRGIHPEQVEIKGLGSQNPIENNDTAWGRMMNRRVEIELIN